MILRLPSREDLWFSLRTFIASMLALYIALDLSLANPIWAMGTVYIVSQPLLGAMRSKTLYRIGGTLTGAAGALLLVPPLSAQPVLLILAVALWSGMFLFFSMLDRSPRTYLFRLPAYTLPLIVFPSVHAPQLVFDIALARTEEILVGIFCANLVAGVALVQRASPVIRKRLAQWFDHVAIWAQELMTGQVGSGSRHQLVVELSTLEQLTTHLGFDTPHRHAVPLMLQLRARMRRLLPLLSSLAAMRQALQREGGLDPLLQVQFSQVAAQLTGAATAEAVVELSDDPPGQSWPGILAWVTRRRLAHLHALNDDCQQLRERLADRSLDGRPLLYPHDRLAGNAHHLDHGLVLFYASSVALGIVLCGLLWLISGWTAGANAMVLGIVGCALFCALDEPAPIMLRFLGVNLASSVLGGLLLFVVLPQVETFEALVACFLLPCLAFGVLMLRPQFSTEALLMIAFTGSTLGLHGAYQADFAGFLEGCLASIGGALVALLWTMLIRPFGREITLARLRQSTFRALAQLALCGGDDYPRLTARLHDRQELTWPRQPGIDGMAEVRLGLALLHLRRQLPSIDGSARRIVEELLGGLGRCFLICAENGGMSPFDSRLLMLIDQALGQLLAGTAIATQDASSALVELRLICYPDAPAPDFSGALVHVR